MHSGALASGCFGGRMLLPPSVYIRLMAPGKNLAPAQNAKYDPTRRNVCMQE